jgi:hypothetical protein
MADLAAEKRDVEGVLAKEDGHLEDGRHVEVNHVLNQRVLRGVSRSSSEPSPSDLWLRRLTLH